MHAIKSKRVTPVCPGLCTNGPLLDIDTVLAINNDLRNKYLLQNKLF